MSWETNFHRHFPLRPSLAWSLVALHGHCVRTRRGSANIITCYKAMQTHKIQCTQMERLGWLLRQGYRLMFTVRISTDGLPQTRLKVNSANIEFSPWDCPWCKKRQLRNYKLATHRHKWQVMRFVKANV